MPHLRSGPNYAQRRIGLLGGSFNPAHDGHRDMSLHALKRLRLHEVWWLVSPQNPLKLSKGMANYAKRMADAKQCAAHPRIRVTNLEEEAGTHYTIDILRILQARYPRTKFIWLMGADNLSQISQWRDWQDIFACLPVAVFRRPAYAAGRRTGKAAIRFERAWRRSERGPQLITTSAPAWRILDNKLNSLSATKIRGELKK